MSNTEELLSKLKPMELPPLPENPLVSVLIANYNYGHYIGEAIESVLNQTYQNFEIVICDDGSTDNSLEVIEQYAKRDPRIRYIAKENGGIASALNAAFSIARGDIICLLDSDDRFWESKIERVVLCFRSNPCAGMLIHPLRVIDIVGRQLRPLPLPRKLDQGWLADQVIANRGVWNSPPASGLCFRSAAVQQILPIPERLRKNADGYLTTSLPLITIVVAILDTLADYRVHTNNVTGIGWANPESIDYLLKLRESLFRDVFTRMGYDLPTELQGESFFDSPVFAEAFLLYYLQTGTYHPLTPSRKTITKLCGEVVGPKRYVYYLLRFFPSALNKVVIRQWHENFLLKKFADRLRLLIRRG